MEFRKIEILPSFGEGKTVTNMAGHQLTKFCLALAKALPLTDVYLGEEEIDIKTLYHSATFRYAIVKFETGSTFDNIEVNWKKVVQHHISNNGETWTMLEGRALKYEVTYKDSQSKPYPYFLGIQFGPVETP